MHNCILPSLFLTKNTRAPQWEALGRIMPLSSKSSNCSFNSLSSAKAILYSTLEIGPVPRMVNSIALSGGNPSKSSENSYGNSFTTRMSSTFNSILSPFKAQARDPSQPFLSNCLACIAETNKGCSPHDLP